MASLKNKKLYLSETNRVLAGVCGGLGEYFEVDSTLIRLIFVVITVFGGSGILIYIILWILIPKESNLEKESEDSIKENVQEMKEKAHRLGKGNGRLIAGLIILLLGISALLNNFGFWYVGFGKLWPLIIIAIGFMILTKRNGK